MESVAKITGQICAICQPGLSVISLPLSTDDTLYQVPIRLAWHFLCRNENVQLVQHNRELTLALARRIGLDLQSRLEGFGALQI